ncbi:MAG: maleylpyruvate isomerase N-terminal domain-containing protein [Actinomycetota bacterium]
MTRCATAAVLPEDVRVAASVCRRVLEPVADADWDRRAGELEWSCRTTLAHVLSALLYYAINLTTRSTELRYSGQTDPSLPIPELLDALEGRAAVLAEVCAAPPPGARGAHDWGLPDAPGFAALACDEMLLHTNDIADGLGADFDPPRDVCARVLTRLFPWAPLDGDGWEVLRWANGRVPLGRRPRLAPSWVSHPSPLDEWDGRDPNASFTVQ